jgi:hypothetical protein
MLSVRLPEPVERELQRYCTEHEVTKSFVVQEALAEWLARTRQAAEPAPPPDLSFLAPDDPIRAFIGILKDGPSTDELMRMTRGDDWNKP